MGFLGWLRGDTKTIGQGASTPDRPLDPRPFVMTVEDVFTITGRGTVVTGTVSEGTVRVDDAIAIALPDRPEPVPARVAGLESSRSRRKDATAGESVGILLVGHDPRQTGIAEVDIVTALARIGTRLERGSVLRAQTR